MKKQWIPLACITGIFIILFLTSRTSEGDGGNLADISAAIIPETTVPAAFQTSPSPMEMPSKTDNLLIIEGTASPVETSSTQPTDKTTPTPIVKPTIKPTVTLTPKPTATPTPTISRSPSPTISGNPSYSGISSYEKQMLEWVNAQRTKAGLNPLSSSSKLTQIARLKSTDMIVNNYFSHTSPTYGSPFEMLHSFGVSYRRAGENLAYNGSLSAAFSAFMKSPGHRANILNSAYTQIGIGVVSNGKGLLYITQLFIG